MEPLNESDILISEMPKRPPVPVDFQSQDFESNITYRQAAYLRDLAAKIGAIIGFTVDGLAAVSKQPGIFVMDAIAEQCFGNSPVSYVIVLKRPVGGRLAVNAGEWYHRLITATPAVVGLQALVNEVLTSADGSKPSTADFWLLFVPEVDAAAQQWAMQIQQAAKALK